MLRLSPHKSLLSADGLEALLWLFTKTIVVQHVLHSPAVFIHHQDPVTAGGTHVSGKPKEWDSQWTETSVRAINENIIFEKEESVSNLTNDLFGLFSIVFLSVENREYSPFPQYAMTFLLCFYPLCCSENTW